MLNLDYLMSAKNTIAFRFYRSWEPQSINFLGAAYLPGTPGTDPFGYHNMVANTTIVNNNMVNELHIPISARPPMLIGIAVNTYCVDIYQQQNG